MGTPVTSLELRECLEQMARMFNTKLEDVASSSRVAMSRSEPLRVQKIELPANDIKLEGTKNYLSWSRRATLLLQTKGLQKYVQKDCTEPADKESDEWRTWNATNSVMVAWLLISMDTSVSGQLETLRSAVDVWKTVETMYSGAGSVMRTMETEEKIDATVQGEKTVQQYASELKHLWADLDHYSPLSLECPADILKGKQYLEQRRTFRFLKGLNSQFEQRRSVMCHMSALPPLDEVIASMEEEEIRQKVMSVGSTTTTVERSALAVPGASTTDMRDCYICGKKGHLSWSCPLSRDSPFRDAGRGRTGRGRGAQRGGRNWRGGRGRTGSRGAANLAVAEDTQHVEALADAEYSELEELRRFKLQVESFKAKGLSTQEPADATSLFGNFA